MKTVLICPNAFKGALDSVQIAQAIDEGLEESGFLCNRIQLPIADGGDGSLAVSSSYLNLCLHEMETRGPLGDPTPARYGINLQTKVALVELAQASGIRHLRDEERNVWNASTFGTGELVRDAIEKGAIEVYLCVGGSASVDGGLGILDALGAKFFDANETPILSPGIRDVKRIARIDVFEIERLCNGVTFYVLCDVINPLLGSEGAAAVFGPQKGASKHAVVELEGVLLHWANLINSQFGRVVHDVERGGSAGGVGAMMYGVFGAKLISGAEKILSWGAFDQQLKVCDFVITGEGKIDKQTLQGKGPGLVAQKAKACDKMVIGLSGGVDPVLDDYECFDVILPIANGPNQLHEALANTYENVRRTAFQVGRLLSIYG